MSGDSPMSEAAERSCPHCGAEVPALPECVHCGIVFDKYRPRPRPASTMGPTTSRPASRSLAPWLALLGLAIGLAVVTGRRGDSPEPGATPPRSVAARPIPVAAQEPSSAAEIWHHDDDFDLEAEIVPEPVTEAVPEPEPEPPAAASADLGASGSVGYDWFDNATGFRSGLELAAARSTPIAVYFYTDWCGYCRQFERELLTRARVEDFTKYLVKVRINPESGRQEREIARRYGVRGYPAFFAHASADAEPRKIRRHKRVGGDWVLQTPADFVVTLERALG